MDACSEWDRQQLLIFSEAIFSGQRSPPPGILESFPKTYSDLRGLPVKDDVGSMHIQCTKACRDRQGEIKNSLAGRRLAACSAGQDDGFSLATSAGCDHPTIPTILTKEPGRKPLACWNPASAQRERPGRLTEMASSIEADVLAGASSWFLKHDRFVPRLRRAVDPGLSSHRASAGA